MSMHNLLTFALALLIAPAWGNDSPGLGQPVADAELGRIARNVFADGQGLPPGRGSAAQGEQLYASHCAACHGAGGQGGPNDALAGPAPARTIGSYWPYATTVFDYIRRAMPLPTPGILSDDQVYAVTAYLLFVNGIVPRDQMLDADSLATIEMPNRKNFVWAVTPGAAP